MCLILFALGREGRKRSPKDAVAAWKLPQTPCMGSLASWEWAFLFLVQQSMAVMSALRVGGVHVSDQGAVS
jgi:hypothetical protein